VNWVKWHSFIKLIQIVTTPLQICSMRSRKTLTLRGCKALFPDDQFNLKKDRIVTAVQAISLFSVFSRWIADHCSVIGLSFECLVAFQMTVCTLLFDSGGH
jgi:hypothetical protein